MFQAILIKFQELMNRLNISEKGQKFVIGGILVVVLLIIISMFGIGQTVKTVEVTEDIKFQVKTDKSPDLFEGSQPYVVNKGANGKKIVKKTVDSKGKTIEVLEEKILKKPVDEITVEGTKKISEIYAMGMKVSTDYYYALSEKNWADLKAVIAPSVLANLGIDSEDSLAESMGLVNKVLTYKVNKIIPLLGGLEKSAIAITATVKEQTPRGDEVENTYTLYGVFESGRWYVIPDRLFKIIVLDGIKKEKTVDGTVNYDRQYVEMTLDKIYVLNPQNMMLTYSIISRNPFNKLIQNIQVFSVDKEKMRFNPGLDASGAGTKDYELVKSISYVTQGDNSDKKWDTFVYNKETYYKITGRIKIKLNNPIYFSSNRNYRFKVDLQPETDSNAFLVYPVFNYDFTYGN